LPKIRKTGRAGGRTVWKFTLSLGTDPVTGRRRQRVYTYGSHAEAKRELARLTGQIADGKFTDRTDMTVNEALDAYLESACFERAANTRVSYAGALLPVRDRLGRRRLQSITRKDVESLRDWMLTSGRRRGGQPGTPLGARSVRLTLGRLRAALELACRDGRLARNPAEHVRLPKQDRRPGSTWSEAELRRFAAAAAGDRLAACWRLSLLGLRRGEVLGLRWADVDLPGRTVTVGRARVLVDARVIEKEPKSERGFRTLPLPDADTAAALAALRDLQAIEAMDAGPAYAGSGYVAADELGAPLHPERYSDEFARLCRAAGVPVIRLHDTRHTANSLLAAAGVPDHIRAAWCGHTVAVNVATYTHARPEDLAVAAKALATLLGGE
jgi:integrase